MELLHIFAGPTCASTHWGLSIQCMFIRIHKEAASCRKDSDKHAAQHLKVDVSGEFALTCTELGSRA
jgi:hypothetical protein